MRESPILHAGNEDDREFKALCGVNRHERDLPASTFFLGKLIRVSNQGNTLKESCQADLAAGLHVVQCNRMQFGKVFHSRGVLRVLGTSQSRKIPRTVQDFFKNFRCACTGLFGAPHGFDQSPKISDCRGRARAEPGHSPSRFLSFFLGKLRQGQAGPFCFSEASALRNPAIPGGRTHRNPIAITVGNEVGLRLGTDSAARGIDDPPQCNRVVGVRDHLKVGQGVFDFRAFVEASTPNDSVGNALANQQFFDCS